MKIAEPAAPRGRDPFAPLQFALRPGNGNDEGESSESLTSGDGGAICGDRGLCTIRNGDRVRGACVRDRGRVHA